GKVVEYTRGPKRMRRILSIDGGGLKGVLPAAFLAAVERDIDGKVADYFDLIAGTSTGAIIALALGLGISAAEVLRFYEEYGPSIFHQESVSESRFLDAVARVGGWIGRNVRRTVIEKYNPDR